ncbi:UNVERIFIED_CONTAM: hypothetical protein Sindi_0241100 [Sesamum indicum]
MDSSKRLVAAVRHLKEDNPPNFGFPELSPPFPRIPIWPPATDLPDHEDRPPNFGFPELSPPFPEIPIWPPEPQSLTPDLKIKSRSSDLPDQEDRPPNFGFPELSPPFPEIPIWPPETDLPPDFKRESRSSLPPVSESL